MLVGNLDFGARCLIKTVDQLVPGETGGTDGTGGYSYGGYQGQGARVDRGDSQEVDYTYDMS